MKKKIKSYESKTAIIDIVKVISDQFLEKQSGITKEICMNYFEQFWAILSNFEQFYVILSDFEQFWTILSDSEWLWAILNDFERDCAWFWTILSDFDNLVRFWTFLSDSERFKVISSNRGVWKKRKKERKTMGESK